MGVIKARKELVDHSLDQAGQFLGRSARFGGDAGHRMDVAGRAGAYDGKKAIGYDDKSRMFTAHRDQACVDHKRHPQTYG